MSDLADGWEGFDRGNYTRAFGLLTLVATAMPTIEIVADVAKSAYAD